MNHFEKIQNVLNGVHQKEIPYSFWFHMPEVDLNPKAIAKQTCEIQEKYNLDFIKTSNNGMYMTEDYGTEIDHSDVHHGGYSRLVRPFIESNEDWKKVRPMNINQPALNRELEFLQLTIDKKGKEVPIIMTIFSPLTTLNKMTCGNIAKFATENNEYLHEALRNISETTKALVQKAISMGASGIFFATQLHCYDILTVDQVKEYANPYDKMVLEGLEGSWFNLIHIHGNNIMFGQVTDYPVEVFNWHIGETLPEPREVQLYNNKVVSGGFSGEVIKEGSYEKLNNDIYKIAMATKGEGLILSPSCVIPNPINEDMLNYIYKIKKETEDILEHMREKE